MFSMSILPFLAAVVLNYEPSWFERGLIWTYNELAAGAYVTYQVLHSMF